MREIEVKDFKFISGAGDAGQCASAIEGAAGIGMTAGGLLGGAAGSVIPGVGTAVGGTIGAGIGALVAGGYAAANNPSCQGGQTANKGADGDE